MLVEDLAKKPYREKIADAQEALRLLAEVKALPLGKDKEETAALLWWQNRNGLSTARLRRSNQYRESYRSAGEGPNLPEPSAERGVPRGDACFSLPRIP